MKQQHCIRNRKNENDVKPSLDVVNVMIKFPENPNCNRLMYFLVRLEAFANRNTTLHRIMFTSQFATIFDLMLNF